MPFRRFLHDTRASVAPMLALAALPLLGFVGAAVDFSRAASVRTAMQAALDASALMLSRDYHIIPSAELGTKAIALFGAQFRHPDGGSVAVTATRSSAGDASHVTMAATTDMPTRFMGMFGFQALNVVARTQTVTYSDGLGCVLALDRSASGSVTGQGSTAVMLKGCSVYANSNSNAAIAMGGSARLETYSAHAVGNISGAENITASHGIHAGSAMVNDPYADLAYPAFFGCTNHNFKANSDATIDPGTYCGGMSVNAGATLTLNPGIYYIDGGSLTVNGGATLVGTGVTLVFTSKNRNGWADARINGNATVFLTAPKTGPTAGIVVFGDRNMTNDTNFKFNGGVNQYFGGAIYLSQGSVEYSGGASTGTSCTQLIARSITFTGNSAFAINCENQGTRHFSASVTRIVS